MNFDIVFNVPTWAALYIMYREQESLSAKDKKECDSFLIVLKRQGIVRFIEPADCSEQAFNRHPAFGKPCSTQDWIVEVDNV